MVSAPNTMDEDLEGESAASGRPRVLQPNAPVFYEDDLFDVRDPRVPQSPMDDPQPETLGPSTLVPHGVDLHSLNNTSGSGLADAHGLVDDENLPLYRR